MDLTAETSGILNSLSDVVSEFKRLRLIKDLCKRYEVQATLAMKQMRDSHGHSYCCISRDSLLRLIAERKCLKTLYFLGGQTLRADPFGHWNDV